MAATLQTMREGAGTQHPEEIVNFFNSRMVATSGVFDKPANEFLVEQSDTPAMSVDVRQGYAFLRKSNGQMVYPVWLKTEDALVAITSNSSGSSRIDSVVLYIDLGATANPAISNVAKLVAVAGTPAGSPVAPDSTAILAAIGASNPYIVLANVTVASGATSIVDANISDQRTDVVYNSAIRQGVIQTATDAATVTFDLNNGRYRMHQVTLGGNRTLALSNALVGQVFMIMFIQDGTGSRTVTWFAGGTDTVTMTIATPGVVTTTLDIKTGTPVVFTTTGALPTGITASTVYYWIRQSATTGNVASSKANALAGTAITTSGSQSGVHTMKPQILWAGGTAPTLTTSKHATDTIGFIYKSTGTIQGYVVGQDV